MPKWLETFLMNLEVVRRIFNKTNIIGDLYIDSVWFCYTLEDITRDVKVKHQTAIPYGEYSVILSLSTRFKRVLPEVLNVPGFAGIRIHSGNSEADTSGCILIGYQTNDKTIWESKNAVTDLVEKLTGVNEITLKITKDE